MRIIKAKVKGGGAKLTPTTEPRQAEVVDLMERLRRSLEQSGGKRAGATPHGAKKKSKPSRARKKHAA
jgi:non-homologous end joining protein Ku